MKNMGEPTKKVCPNCRNNWIDGNKYCCYCGSKMTEPSAVPVEFACIYGPPPISRTHECRSCGYKWETFLMIDREKYCPKCGSIADVTEEHSLF